MLLKVPNVHFPIVLIHFQPLKRATCRTTFLQRTKWLVPICPIFRDSTVVTIIYQLCTCTVGVKKCPYLTVPHSNYSAPNHTLIITLVITKITQLVTVCSTCNSNFMVR